MERLYQKASIASVSLMISFALIVGLWNSETNPDPRVRTARETSESPRIVRPLKPAAVNQQQKPANTIHFLPVTTEPGGSIKQVDVTLDDLPELDVFNHDNRPKKLVPPFEGVEVLTKKPDVPEKAPAQEDSPKVEPQPEKTKTQPKTLHVNIAPAIVNTFFQKIKYANSLARRGAVSSAKAELQLALRLLAEAIDQLKKTNTHTKDLKEAMVALKEMEDFASWGQDMSIFVAGHTTDILRDKDLEKMTTNDARFAYLELAERKLLSCCQNISIASEVFRSLGKVYSMSDHFAADQAEMSAAKSMLMFRLATIVNPRDADSANELAVLYAKYNHMAKAKELLVSSLKVRNETSTWYNLAKVHQALGEDFLAQQAANEARISQMNSPNTKRIQWTNPIDFNSVQSMVDPPVMTANRPQSDNNPNSRQNARR